MSKNPLLQPELLDSFPDVQTTFYNDYQQVTVWNDQYLDKFKIIPKPWYQYLLGTMTEAHIMARYHVILAHLDGFFRTFGMF